MKIRLIEEIGVRLSLRRYWGGQEEDGSDACAVLGGRSYHNAQFEIERVFGVRPTLRDTDFPKPPHDDLRWPKVCESCGEAPPDTAAWQLFSERLYSSASGRPEPGDAYFTPWTHDGGQCFLWDNCTDPRGHLYVILPNGDSWDTDSRASNCGKPHDRLHRCWVKHGTIEAGDLTIDKAGNSCDAGGGSIASAGSGGLPAWHGFLLSGELVVS